MIVNMRNMTATGPQIQNIRELMRKENMAEKSVQEVHTNAQVEMLGLRILSIRERASKKINHIKTEKHTDSDT